MSAFTVLNDVTLELRQRFFDALATAPGVTLNFTDMAVNIPLTAPQENSDASERLSLYLYHVNINNALRNQKLLAQPGRDDELRLPPLPLELRFLLTPIDEEDNNQLILGRLIQFIYDNPSIETLDGVAIGDSFGGGSSELRMTPDLLNVEQLSQIWNAFNQPYRLSISIQVDVVAVDSAKQPVVAPRVVQAIAASGTKQR